ncbi:MAG: hypothetical protein JW956_07795, partial [Calditrichaceae bacterium]|nr:hypothetical protein [Calditrichaceae bacterium]
KAFKGGFCINQWLIENGYLVLKEEVNMVKKISAEMIDWKRTKVWAEGGYYARCFFNIKGREISGTIDMGEVERLKEKIKSELGFVKDEKGFFLKHKVLFPEKIYVECNGIPPDMMIYPDDLNYRAISSIGHDSFITNQNDSGPDGANHDYEGLFILTGKGLEHKKVKQISIYDVLPTILSRMDMPLPEDIKGKVVV